MLSSRTSGSRTAGDPRGQVHKFLCAGTLEEKIDAMIEGKKEVAERVVGTGEGWLTELSTAELMDLMKLRSEAVGEVAKLLASEMPEDVEKAFESAGLSLFPERRNDLATECSCPDWSNPCNHIAAVFYLLGEEFDRDPFLIFKLRGVERQELVGLLGTASARGPAGSAGSSLDLEEEAEVPAEPLRPDVGAFWSGEELAVDPFGDVAIPVTGPHSSAGSAASRSGAPLRRWSRPWSPSTPAPRRTALTCSSGHRMGEARDG